MTAALDALESDWRSRRDRVCRLAASESSAASVGTPFPVRLRCTPVKCDPEHAASDFGVDDLWRPAGFIRHRFAAVGPGLARDAATGLLWQVSGSPYPICWREAHAHVAALNRDSFEGLNGWRIPTAPELMSLLMPTPHGADFCTEAVFDRRQTTLWSSDRRSFAAAWFVNTEMGFVAWQDVSSGCYVRAVCSVL
jgi:serine/threonine-protein kinase